MFMQLILDNISKRFPGRRVFDGISAEVNKGEKLVITGPNGSGKTTLLKIISSLLPSSSGKVILKLNDRALSGNDILPHTGYAAPDMFLYDELTAAENLRFFARVSGIAETKFENELARFGLKGRGDDSVRSFSSGMKQRLKFILAIIRKPALLLLDEPATNLDDSGRSIIDGIIRNHEGIAVIATNEPDELSYGNHTIRL
jgi:heme exporter protein A